MNDAGEFGFDISGIKAYSGYYLDPGRLRESASGGAASAIAEGFLGAGGVVFGVTYGPDFRSAEYCCAERPEELERMKGSKYIASRKEVCVDGAYRSVYRAIQDKLENGYRVLFIGLGCDVGAVCRYLEVRGVGTENLYTMDLICHGPTSPEVAAQYLDALEKKRRSRVVDFTVRYKKTGWVPPYLRAVFESGEVYERPFYETDYGRAFSRFPRAGCFHCGFRGAHHASDLTVGDYWGVPEKPPEYNKDGVSILFLNRPGKGETLLELLDRETFHLREADVVRALKGNASYHQRRKKPKGYDQFAKNFAERGLHDAVARSTGIRARAKSALKSVLPQGVIKALKKARGRS